MSLRFSIVVVLAATGCDGGVEVDRYAFANDCLVVRMDGRSLVRDGDDAYRFARDGTPVPVHFEPADLGIYCGIDLARQGGGRVPVDDPNQTKNSDAEQTEIDQREPECPGPVQPNPGHGGSTPRPLRCAAGAGRNPDRSCPAAG